MNSSCTVLLDKVHVAISVFVSGYRGMNKVINSVYSNELFLKYRFYSDRIEKMDKGIKILEEFKAAALTELDTVSNYRRFYPTYNYQGFKNKRLSTAILKVIEIIMRR